MLLHKFGTNHINKKSTLCSPYRGQFDLKIRLKEIPARHVYPRTLYMPLLWPLSKCTCYFLISHPGRLLGFRACRRRQGMDHELWSQGACVQALSHLLSMWFGHVFLISLGLRLSSKYNNKIDFTALLWEVGEFLPVTFRLAQKSTQHRENVGGVLAAFWGLLPFMFVFSVPTLRLDA